MSQYHRVPFPARNGGPEVTPKEETRKRNRVDVTGVVRGPTYVYRLDTTSVEETNPSQCILSKGSVVSFHPGFVPLTQRETRGPTTGSKDTRSPPLSTRP